MTTLDQLTGLGHIMITPFDTDEAIDERGLRDIVDYAIQSGVAALIPLGIMGEVHKLTDLERDLVIDVVVEHTAGRVPVIVGCTTESTVATLNRIKRASSLGADGVMVAAPRAVAGSPVLQISYYEVLCEAGDLPIVVQDEPVTTGVVMSGESLGKIVTHERATAIKVEQAPSPTKISAILEANPGARCFGGLGGLYTVEELDRGAVGVMTGFAIPAVLARICAAYLSGDRAEARRIFFHLLPLIRYEAQLGVGGVSIRKQLLVERRVIAHSIVRSPSTAGDPHTLQELKRLVEELVESA